MFGEKLIATLGLDSSEFETKVGGAQRMVGALNGVLGSIGLGLGAGMVIAFFKSVIDRGGELQDLSDQLGVTTDSIQSLDYAAKQAGLSGEVMGMVYSKLTVAAAEAGDKTTTSAKALAALSISAQEFNAAAPDRRLEMVAKAYAAADDKQAGFAAVSDLLGAKIAPRLQSVLKELAEKGLDGVTKSAKEAGQVMDKDVIERMDALGDRLSALKTSAMTYGAAILQRAFDIGDFFGRVGAAVGENVAGIVNAIDGIPSSFADSEDAADKVTLAVEKITVAMKGTLATEADLKRLEEAREKLREKAMTDEEKQSAWMTGYVQKVNEAMRYSKSTHEYTVAMVEAEGFRLKIAEQQAAQAKKVADERKKLDDASRLATDDMLEMLRLENKGVDRLVGSERVRFDLLQLQVWKKREEAEAASLLEKGLDKLTPKENDRLNLLIKAREATDKEITAKTALFEEVKKVEGADKAALAVLMDQNKALDDQNKKRRESIEISRVGKDYADQSTEQLNYVRNQLSGQTQDMTNDRSFSSALAPGAKNPMLYLIEAELANVEKELRARSDFKTYLGGMGEVFTRRMYSPMEYERLSKATTEPDKQTEIADTLTSIEARLKRVFPKAM